MAEYIEAKSILSRLKDAPDPYFGITYNMNLYRGCQHQCIYCDTRSLVYGVGDLSHIRVKCNALELLVRELRSKRKKATLGTGSMNDPYMPIEAKEKLTQRALQLIARHKYPMHVLTKSDLLLRDTDILREISRTYAAVSFTITTADDKLAKQIEPGAPASSKRFKAITELSKKGIYTGVILTPVLPFITDRPENIRQIIRMAKDSGAQYLLGWMGMTQREGQREYYYNQLNKLFPGLASRYAKAYGNKYQCSPPNANKLFSLLQEESDKVSLPLKMNFYQPQYPEQLNLF